MNTVKILSRRTLLVDAALLTLICLIPTISHLLGLPLQAIEPMRLALLASMLLVSDSRNAVFMALAMPLLAMLTTGFPMGAKCALIAVELAANVVVFQLLARRMSTFAAMLISIVSAKALYYGLKLLVLGSLVATTAIWLQALVAVVLSTIFAVVYNRIQQ